MNEDGSGLGWAGQDTFSGQDIPGGRFPIGGGLRVLKSAANPLLDPTCITGLQMDFE